MAISPRRLIERYLEEYNVDLFEVCCITMIDPDIMYPYMNREIKRLSVSDRARLVRLYGDIRELFDELRYSDSELKFLKVLGMTLMTPEQIHDAVGIPIDNTEKILAGKNIVIGPASVAAMDYVVGRFQSLEKIREETCCYLKNAMRVKQNDDMHRRREAAKIFTSHIQELLDNHKSVEQQNEIAGLEDSISEKEDELVKLRCANQELTKALYERDEEVKKLKEQVYLLENRKFREEALKEDVGTAELLYQKDARIADLTERLKRKTEASGSVQELYNGELDYILTEVISQYINDNSNRQRRVDILTEFLQKFVTTDVNATKELLREASKVLVATPEAGIHTPCIQAGPFTLDLIATNTHNKYRINNDERYTAILAVTPSDFRAGDETAKFFLRTFT